MGTRTRRYHRIHQHLDGTSADSSTCRGDGAPPGADRLGYQDHWALSRWYLGSITLHASPPSVKIARRHHYYLPYAPGAASWTACMTPSLRYQAITPHLAIWAHPKGHALQHGRTFTMGALLIGLQNEGNTRLPAGRQNINTAIDQSAGLLPGCAPIRSCRPPPFSSPLMRRQSPIRNAGTANGCAA
jgi:hypothetical protein